MLTINKTYYFLHTHFSYTIKKMFYRTQLNIFFFYVYDAFLLKYCYEYTLQYTHVNQYYTILYIREAHEKENIFHLC